LILDFLVDETPDSQNIPDKVYNGALFNVSYPVEAQLTATVTTLSASDYRVTCNPSTGWTYIRIDNPQNSIGSVLGSVMRSDGVALPSLNTWRTRNATFDFLHILDFSSTGNYTLSFQTLAPPQNCTVYLVDVSRIGIRWTPTPGATWYRIDITINGVTSTLATTSQTNCIFFITFFLYKSLR